MKEEQKETQANINMRLKTLLRKAVAMSWKGDIERSLEILAKGLSEDVEALTANGMLQQFESAR